ncbi:MAG: nuclear transport factor 2 family protein [Spirosomataceae bacterium]
MKTIKLFLILASLAFCLKVSAQSPELIKKNIITAYESLNKHDFVAFKSVCTPTELAGPTPIKGGCRHRSLQMFFTLSPDMKFTVKNVVIDGNRAFVENTLIGTNTGVVMGMLPPTGKKFMYTDIDIITIDASGKASSHSSANPNEIFHQIGYGALVNPNTSVVYGIYQCFGKGDVNGIMDALATNVSFDVRDNPAATTKKIYTSKAEIPMFFKELVENVEVTKFEPYRVFADGDGVLAAINVEWKNKATGKKWSSLFNHNFKLENGKVSWFKEIVSAPIELKGM